MPENTYKIRIGKKLIPVSKRLYIFYYRSRRRIKYYEHDIKIEIAVRDDDGEIIAFIPSKEDALLQKSYRTDMVPFLKIKNKGEKDQYYLHNLHEPIICRTDYEQVQLISQTM